MKKIIKQSFNTALSNWTTLLLFELFYKVVCYSLVYSISQDILNYALRTAGIPYLSFENIHLLVTNPVSVILLIVLLLFITLITFFEISALYYYCEKSWLRERLTVWQLIKHTALNCRELLHIKKLLFFWGFMLTVLLAVSPFSQHVLGWVKIPEFIMDFIIGNKLFLLWSVVILILLNYIFFLYLFTLPSVMLLNKKVGDSWNEGTALLKKRKIDTLVRILFSFAAFFLIIFTLAAAGLLGLAAYTKIFYPAQEAEAVFRFLYKSWGMPAFHVASTVGTIWLFAVIVVLFHDYRDDIRPAPLKREINVVSIVKRTLIILATIFLLLLFSETELGGNFIYQDRTSTQIIAHRAGAVFAPENTVSALSQAIADKADCAEIDVQQLKDGTLIVMHDSNFKRTTGNNKNVWDVTYPEIKDYDAGSSFSSEFTGEPIPTLEDMLKNAKNKINLMIELKLTGHERTDTLEKQTLKLIDKYDMLPQCTIASMNLDILEKIKKLEPRIDTVYITPLLYSQNFDISYLDGYSIETTSLSRDMVNSIKSQGKKVYGWTANSEDTINKNLRYQVNGIITDNPLLAEYYIDTVNSSISLNTITDIFF